MSDDESVLDLDEHEDFPAARLRHDVLHAPLGGGGVDLALVRAGGRRRRRQRRGAQVGGTLLGAAVVGGLALGLPLPSGGDAAPPAGAADAVAVLSVLGTPPDAGDRLGPSWSSAVDIDTARSLGGPGPDQYWAALDHGGNLCLVYQVQYRFSGATCDTVTTFAEEGLMIGVSDDGDVVHLVLVPDGFDTTNLRADAYVPVAPNVLMLATLPAREPGT